MTRLSIIYVTNSVQATLLPPTCLLFVRLSLLWPSHWDSSIFLICTWQLLLIFMVAPRTELYGVDGKVHGSMVCNHNYMGCLVVEIHLKTVKNNLLRTLSKTGTHRESWYELVASGQVSRRSAERTNTWFIDPCCVQEGQAGLLQRHNEGRVSTIPNLMVSSSPESKS